MNVSIRRATKRDYKSISELLQILHVLHVKNRDDVYLENDNILTENQYMNILKNDNKMIYVAINQDIVIGYILSSMIKIDQSSVCKKDKILYIDEIIINNKYRRMGIGKRLIEYIKQKGNDIGCKTVQVNVWSFNNCAIEFYKKNGFTTRNIRLESKL